MKSEMTIDEAHNGFIEKFNSRILSPQIVEVSSAANHSDASRFENSPHVLVIPSGDVQQQFAQLGKLFDRFVPASIMADQREKRSLFKKFLKSRGVEVKNRKSDLAVKNDAVKSLAHQGSIGYFPVGQTTKGIIVYERIRYFERELQGEIAAASESVLISDQAREVLNNSVHIGVGMSVGSEVAAVAAKKGIRKFVLADPSTLHADLQGRLGVGFDSRFIGANKAAYMRLALLREHPYADITIYPGGITDENAMDLIHKSHLSKQMTNKKGRLVVVEEADSLKAKILSRQAFHAMKIKNADLFMLGDVGSRVTYAHEEIGSKPFLGYLENADPQHDIYGANLIENNPIGALFATVGGTAGLPMAMLTLLRDGKIGIADTSVITRVPQSREATLLAAAIYANALNILANGGKLKDSVVVDVSDFINSDSIGIESNLEAERVLAAQLSTVMFGMASLA